MLIEIFAVIIVIIFLYFLFSRKIKKHDYEISGMPNNGELFSYPQGTYALPGNKIPISRTGYPEMQGVPATSMQLLQHPAFPSMRG
jgi:hypothetical protein